MRDKILVTGAGGQLAAELKVVSTDYPEFEFVFLNRAELPVDDFRAVHLLFERLQPAYCINCAAYTAVDLAETEKDSAFAINAEAVGALADSCRLFHCRLVHISTDYVFDGSSTIPYKETSPTSPVNWYGASKLKGEQLALENNEATIVIRTSWLYSAFGKNFVKTMIRLMKEKGQIRVVSDQSGSPTYAADLATLIMTIIRSGKWERGIYHYSNNGITTWFGFAKAIKELTGSPCEVLPIASSDYPTPARRPVYSVLNKDKIREVYAVGLTEWKLSLQKCIERLAPPSRLH